MKLQEVFELHNELLEESLVRKALAAAGLVLASIPSTLLHTPQLDLKPAFSAQVHKPDTTQVVQSVERKPDIAKLVSVAAGKYDVDPRVVQRVVIAAIKNAHTDFPTAKDILAVVGVESSFKPNAKSQLKQDPAIGLMQVRPGTWKLPKESLATIESQIETGSKILRKYYLQLGSREAALHAYNIGYGNFVKGKGQNPRYVPKVDKEESLYNDI